MGKVKIQGIEIEGSSDIDKIEINVKYLKSEPNLGTVAIVPEGESRLAVSNKEISTGSDEGPFKNKTKTKDRW